MASSRRKRLDDIGFVWGIHSHLWEMGFDALSSFKKREGHCRVPKRHIEDGLNLWQWVNVQRRNFDTMLPERTRRLIAAGFIRDPNGDAWETAFKALADYKDKEGHLRVPRGIKFEGINLSSWMSTQRQNADTLSTELKRKLDGLGFSWDPRREAWEEGFDKLNNFKNKNGHCRIPSTFKLDNFYVGAWVANQRAIKNMPPELRQRLDDIGFVWDASKGKT